MRLIAVVLAALMVTGCAANSYRIPPAELARLSQTPPAERGQKVRVIQEISATQTNNAPPIAEQNQIIIVPQFDIYTGPRYQRGTYGGGGGGGGGKGVGKLGGGSGSDGKAAAIVFIAIAAVALFAIAGVEGSRFDGYAQLHPMHPVHLIGKDGGYTIMPLAWLDPNAVAWADKAIIKPNEGPFHQLERAPLTRTGATYGMYAGTGTLRSADGSLGAGPAFTIQAGYFPEQHIGILADVMFGWRENALREVLFESRYMLELQAMPLQAGIFHAGGYVGAGLAYRFEDNMPRDKSSTEAYTGGGMLQLDINTRIALTARMGVTKAHEGRMGDLLFGLSVY